MIEKANGGFPSHELILSLANQLTQLRIENWTNQDVFTWQWWLLVAVLILPWFLWWKYVDKKRLLEITLFGAVVLVLASYMDALLSELGLWSYNFWIIPLLTRLIPADFTVIPITYMFIYQRFRSLKSFLFAMTILSALFSFVGEPFLQWIDVYEMHGWKHIYSFPIYLAMGLLIRWLVRILTARQVSIN